LNGYDCRFCHFDHDKRRRKKTRPGFSSPTQNYGEYSHALPLPMENVVSPCTPPGLQTHVPEHGHFNLEVIPGSLPGTGSYLGSTFGLDALMSGSLPQAALTSAQPFGLEGVSQCLPSPLQVAPEYPPLAPPSWPAPSCPSHSVEFQDVQFWTTDRVLEWLVSVGLGHLNELFQMHRISGDVLLELSQIDLAEMGVQALGDRKRILRGIALLQLPPLASNPSSPQGSVFP